MKRICIAAAALLLLALQSCIREEALNSECDITEVDAGWLATLPEGFITGNPVVKNTSVTFFVPVGADITALSPQFRVTPGATLFKGEWDERIPFSAEERYDFTGPQYYSVLSEDGAWHKTYRVTFETPRPLDEISFEHFGMEDERQRFQCLWQEQTDGTLSTSIWDSGNAGYAMTGMAQGFEDYPTVFTAGGVRGLCAKLETKNTGEFGRAASMPIAAGNLFIGEFRTLQAMLAPRKATRFGLQIAKGEPATLSGYYKYTAGATVIDRAQNVLAEKHDTCDIYAVLYEVEPGNVVALNGDDILSSGRIVSLARIDDPGEPQEWQYFEEPFRPMNGKRFDPERFRRNGYAFTIVMTSSRQGAHFEGAIGSVLYVDELKVTWAQP